MKNTLLLIGALTIFIACDQTSKTNSESPINEMDLPTLNAKKETYTTQINQLNITLEEINAAIEKKTGNEKRVLVSSITATPQQFDHTIELQANVKTRKDLELYPEIGGRLIQFYTKEGQRVKKGTLLAILDDSGMQDQLEQLELQMELAKTGFERTKRLWDQKIGSEMMFTTRLTPTVLLTSVLSGVGAGQNQT